jgi:hypothetical protein
MCNCLQVRAELLAKWGAEVRPAHSRPPPPPHLEGGQGTLSRGTVALARGAARVTRAAGGPRGRAALVTLWSLS